MGKKLTLSHTVAASVTYGCRYREDWMGKKLTLTPQMAEAVNAAGTAAVLRLASSGKLGGNVSQHGQTRRPGSRSAGSRSAGHLRLEAPSRWRPPPPELQSRARATAA